MEKAPPKKSFLKRFLRIVLKTVLFLIAFFLVIILLVLTPPVQNLLRKKAVAYLENKLDTKVQIGRIFIGLPKKVVLENVYIEDRAHDTLVSAGSLKADIAIIPLIFKGEVDINRIELKNSTARIIRSGSDSAFNFQFIVDAFAPAESTAPKDTSASAPISIRHIDLDKVRLVYNDVVTGNDIEAWINHFDTRIDKIDPDHLVFDVPETTLKGFTARVYQVKPLAAPEPDVKDKIEASEPMAVQLNLKNINLEDVSLDYRNDVSAMYTQLAIGNTSLRINKLDLAHQLIDIASFSLADTRAAIRLGKKEVAKVVVNETKKEIDTRAEAGWRFVASSIEIDNTDLRFDDDNQTTQANGMNYAHLDADSLTLHAKDFILSLDSIGGQITRGSVKEKSGFVLNQLETKFLYTDHQASLDDLMIVTPGSELKRSATIRYASPEALQKDIGNMELDVDIENSKLLVSDVLLFAPALRSQPAFGDPSATWYVNSRIRGKVRDMQVDALQVQGLRDTRVNVSGHLAGLPDMNNIVADIHIHDISTSKRDIDLIIPRNTLPTTITLPSTMHLRGNAKGNTTKMLADLQLSTSLGLASVKGEFHQLGDPENIRYVTSVDTRGLDLGTILQQRDNLGPVTAFFTLKGKGTDPKTANLNVEGKVQSIVLKQYTYRNLDLTGSLANQRLTFNTGIVDPNLHFALSGEADLANQYPSLVVTGMIDSIKTLPLNLTPDVLIYRGKIDARFPVTNPDHLEGQLLLSQSILVVNDQRIKLDTVRLLAGNRDTAQFITLNSDIVNAEIAGQYQLTRLGDIFQQAIQPYFSVKPATSTAIPPYDFRITGNVVNSPALTTFIPGLERADSVYVQSHFSSTAGWNASLSAPVIDMGPNHIRGLQLQAGTGQGKIDVKATLRQFKSGPTIEIDNTTLTASLANNNIDFLLNIKDRNLKDKYNIGGNLHQSALSTYSISLHQDSLLLNYDTWTISPYNRVLVAGNKFNAADFILGRNGQQLEINSINDDPNAPMEVSFSNFRLATLTGFVQTDSTLADGLINGKLSLIDLTSNPVFTGDLTLNDLRFHNDTIGNVRMLVNNKVSNTYNADITITGRGNDVRLAGSYTPLSETSNFDFTLDVRKLPLTTAEALSNHAIRNSSGYLNGKFTVGGTLNKPAINGDLVFNQARFNFSMLNSTFTVDQEKIQVNNEGIRFDRFSIKDSTGNSLTIDGTAATNDFQHYKFDLRARANDFQALNSTKKDNDLFYGQLFFNTNLTVKGTEQLPLIDGRISVNEKTKMTIVLPQREPGVVERDGVVEFVDFDATIDDSLFLAPYDSLNVSQFKGMEIAATIEVDKAADLTMIVDEGNGDFLNVKGEALLTANVDRTGKIILAGTYALESGSYELSFNLLKRKFEIEKGSKITWEGEPTAATVDITAKYVANVAPLDLVKSQLSDEVTTTQRNTYLQKLPFDVTLKMEGALLQPTISFDIILPADKSYVVSNDIVTNVRTRLEQLRQEEGEMNKQVFSILLLNRFVAENPFNSSEGGPSASTLARQSVSKLLTEQLNRLAGEIVKGVDLNFDVQSSEDYTTGQRRDRTDLNVGLSKQLLNDRLTVTVGSNFELEGPQNSNQQGNNIAGNVALDYKLSSDGRYLLRAYRKNEYQGVIDGYVIETGVGFIITLDYNRFREIFQSKKKRQQEREERRRRILESQPPAEAPETEKKQG